MAWGDVACKNGSEGEGAGRGERELGGSVVRLKEQTEKLQLHSPDRLLPRSADERVAMLELLVAIDDKRVRCLDVTD